jgi:hypothetical protein
MSDLKIEIGKFYKTRDGRKVRIYHVDKQYIHGAVYIEREETWGVRCWSDSGQITPSGNLNGCDIVEEWKEKPVFNYPPLPWMKFAAQDRDGRWFFYEKQPSLSSDFRSFSNGGHYLLIPVEFYPAYSGDWKDSLIEL